MRCRCIFIFVLITLAAFTGQLRADSTGGVARRKHSAAASLEPRADTANHARVIVTVNRRIPLDVANALIEAHGGIPFRALRRNHLVVASVPFDAITMLIRHHEILDVEFDDVGSWFDVELTRSWGVRQTRAGQVQRAHITGRNVRVAVLDKGIDARHPEFNDAYRGGWDFIDHDPNPFVSRVGHGTHVAGAVCAADDGVGVVGVSPGCELYMLRIGAADGPRKSAVIAALEWCIDNDIHVTNSSFGFFGDQGGALRNAYRDSWDEGLLHVAAAGNTGGQLVGIPAKFTSVIAVGAVDHTGRVASFSAQGSEIELVAPGVGVPTVDGASGYTLGMGTSIAAPHVAGVAALVIASGSVRDENGNGRINDEVRRRLSETATDLDDPGVDDQTGAGLVNAWRAIQDQG